MVPNPPSSDGSKNPLNCNSASVDIPLYPVRGDTTETDRTTPTNTAEDECKPSDAPLLDEETKPAADAGAKSENVTIHMAQDDGGNLFSANICISTV